MIKTYNTTREPMTALPVLIIPMNKADCKYFLLQDLDEVSVMREQLAETNAQVARLQAINAEANTKIDNLTQTLLLMEKRLTLVENQLKVTVGN